MRSDPARSAAFAKRLKAIMRERELSASDVAAKMWGRYTNAEGKNVARGRDRLSVWLNGLNFPDAKNLPLLAKVLDVKTTDLVTDAELQALVRTEPAASMVLYPGGKALVSINQIFPLEIAIEIMNLAGKGPAT